VIELNIKAMAYLEMNSNKNFEEIKSIKKAMENANKIAESSGIYMALDKKDWTSLKKHLIDSQ